MDSKYFGWNESAQERRHKATLIQIESNIASCPPDSTNRKLQHERLLLELVGQPVQTRKARANELAPVSRLPHELLIYIFTIIRDTPNSHWKAIANFVRHRPRALKLGWILVTHVCRRWRNVAIRCPALWTEVTFKLGLRWAERILMRAQQCSLSFDAYGLGPFSTAAVATHNARMISHHLTHIHTLKLSAGGHPLQSILESLVDPAPELHTLRLYHDRYVSRARMDQKKVTVPLNFLGGNVSKLQSLSLLDMSFPLSWISADFKDLRTLCIGFQDYRTDLMFDYMSFLRVLKNMPNLETLNLHHSLLRIAHEAVEIQSQVDRVRLPYLANLYLNDGISSILPVLNVLELPSHGNIIRLRTYTRLLHTTERQSTNLLRILARHLTSTPETLIPFCDISISGPGELHITGIVKRNDESQQTVVFEFPPMSASGAMQAFFSCINSEAVRSMEIGSRRLLDTFSWPDWLANVPLPHASTTESLSTNGRGLAQFCAFLRYDTTPFPNLLILTIKAITTSLAQEVKRSLVEALRSRRDRGAPLQVLVFDRCSPDAVDGEWVLALEDVVPEVVLQNMLSPHWCAV